MAVAVVVIVEVLPVGDSGMPPTMNVLMEVVDGYDHQFFERLYDLS